MWHHCLSSWLATLKWVAVHYPGETRAIYDARASSLTGGVIVVVILSCLRLKGSTTFCIVVSRYRAGTNATTSTRSAVTHLDSVAVGFSGTSGTTFGIGAVRGLVILVACVGMGNIRLGDGMKGAGQYSGVFSSQILPPELWK